MKRTLMAVLVLLGYLGLQIADEDKAGLSEDGPGSGEGEGEESEDHAALAPPRAPQGQTTLRGLKPENPNFNFGKFRMITHVLYPGSGHRNENFAVTFLRLSRVGKLVVSGARPGQAAGRFRFRLQGSVDGKGWVEIGDGQPFEGSLDKDNEVQICFVHRFFARKLRILPLEARGLSSMTVDVYLSMKDNVNMDQNRPEFFSQIRNPKTGRMNGFCDQLVFGTIYQKYGAELMTGAVLDFLVDDLLLHDAELAQRFGLAEHLEEVRHALAAQLAGWAGAAVARPALGGLAEAQAHPKFRVLLKLALQFTNIDDSDIEAILENFDRSQKSLIVGAAK